VERCHAKLVFGGGGEPRVQIHDFVLIAQLLRQLEKQSHFEGSVFGAIFTLNLRLFVLVQRIQTARLVHVDVLVDFAAFQQLVIHVHRLFVVAIMEGAIGNGEQSFGL